MALPNSRNLTYSPGAPVRSVDLNDLQDQIIAMHAELRGPRLRFIPAMAGKAMSNTGAPVGNFDDAHGEFQVQNVSHVLWIPIELKQGERLLSVAAIVDPGGVAVASMRLHRINVVANPIVKTGIGSPVDSDGTSNHQTLTLAGLTELAGATPIYYAVDFAWGQVGDIVYGLLVSTDIP
jgi:hypothetical protein